MNQFSRKVVFILSILIFGYVSLGYLFARTSDNKAYRSLTVFSEVLERVQQDYVDEPNMHLVTSGALHGLLESLDPDSSYLSPKEYSQFKKDSEHAAKGKVGLALSKRFGYVIVVSVLPDSPAQKAGLRAGNLIEAIADFTTREMSLGQAELLLAGDPGTTVKVSVVRRGSAQPHEVDLTRAVLEPAHLMTDRVEGDIAYLRVPEFNAGRTGEIRQKLAQFGQQDAHKLILDLRDCATGQIPEAISTAQLFLPSGTITTLKGQTVAPRAFAADSSKVVWNQPMTVLINGSTSGAAEVLAAAIADNHRGDTVGESTFGTASEQKLIPLEDGAALILTVADYYTPTNKVIVNEGVAPTAEIRTSTDQAPALDDEEAPSRPAPGELPSSEDPVMKKAIEILKGATSSQRAA